MGKIDKFKSIIKFKLIFEAKISNRTIKNHFSNKKMITDSRINLEGNNLIIPYEHQRVIAKYLNCLRDYPYKIYIHRPSINFSPGGFSLYTNMAEAMSHLGVKVKLLDWDKDACDQINAGEKFVILSSFHNTYLKKLDITRLINVFGSDTVKVGLTAPIFNNYDSGIKKIQSCLDIGVSFFYSFHDKKWLEMGECYKVYRDLNQRPISYRFGGNPKKYYPINFDTKKFDFVFLASSNYDKRERYYQYLTNIFQKYYGYIDGPGWSHCKGSYLSQNLHRYAYSLSKVGLNLHIDDSIINPSELNERLYNLALMEIPQISDNARLINKYFSKDSIYVAETSNEYLDIFDALINEEVNYSNNVITSRNEVLREHTTYHRAHEFLKKIN